MLNKGGKERAVILVKASPQASTRYQETVCCAGVTPEHRWVRLFPVQFRLLDDAKKFGRWNWVEYNWRRPINDPRLESRHVSDDKIAVAGKLSARERFNFLSPLIVTGLASELKSNRTLALLRPTNVRFSYKKRDIEDIENDRSRRIELSNQQDFFSRELIPLEPCPYVFRYNYDCDDGKRTSTCYDWETDATFFRFRKTYGEEEALRKLMRIFDEEYPSKGVVFAMGTHSRRPEQWLLVGVIRLDMQDQLPLL